MPGLGRPCTPATLGILAFCLICAWPAAAEAYIGPGAGFALLSSFLVALVTIVAVIGSLLIWPFRTVWRLVRYGRGQGGAHRPARDRRPRRPGPEHHGPSPGRRAPPQLRDARPPGELPSHPDHLSARVARRVVHLRHGRDTGQAQHLRFPRPRPPHVSAPAVVDRHRHDDSRVEDSAGTGFRSGSRRIRLLRKSKPFWTILGEHRIWSTVLRVPITFPPDRFYGAELSAMAVPDLLGTQGTFLLFTTRPSGERFKEGGIRVPLVVVGLAGRGRAPRPGEHVPRRQPAARAPARDRARRGPRGRDGHHWPGAHAPRRWRAERLDLAHVQGDARRQGGRPHPPAGARARRARLALRRAPQHRSRAAGDAGLPPGLLRQLPCEEDRPFRDARPRRGHVGAQRGRHRRWDVPEA